MGQYYKPVCIDRKEYLYTHEYDNGLKLMEHSYIGNPFMGAVCTLLLPGGSWHRMHIVWAGDYANPEPIEAYPDWNEKENGGPSLYAIMSEYGTKIHPPATPLPEAFHYLVNHSNRLVIDMATLQADAYGYVIHPLPLMTAEGNGRGGGDFRGKDERVGCWARDEMSIEDHIPDGYTVVDGQFTEE